MHKITSIFKRLDLWAAIITVIGISMIGGQNIYGWVVMSTANVFWILYWIPKKEWVTIILVLVYQVVNAISFYDWLNV
jgi:hypothetical protein